MKELTTFKDQVTKLTKSYEELISSMKNVVSSNLQKQSSREQQDAKYKLLQHKYMEFEDACDQLFFMLESVKKSVFTMYVTKRGKAMDELDKKKKQEDELLDQMTQDEEMMDLEAFQQSAREFGNLMEMRSNLAKTLEQINQS